MPFKSTTIHAEAHESPGFSIELSVIHDDSDDKMLMPSLRIINTDLKEDVAFSDVPDFIFSRLLSVCQDYLVNPSKVSDDDEWIVLDFKLHYTAEPIVSVIDMAKDHGLDKAQ